MDSHALLPDRLRRHATERPDEVAFRVVSRASQEITWGELWARSLAVAASFGASGQRIAIACEETMDFIAALAACLISGNIAVPTPVTLSRRSAPRTEVVLRTGKPVALVTGSVLPDWLAEVAARHDCRIIQFDETASSPVDSPAVSAESDLALIQFSSGSTGSPKGIGLSHANIAANCRAIAAAYGFSQQTRMVSWLPLHHDMGLIGHVVFPMWMGCRSTIMNPLKFLQRPLSWLQLIDEERATITSAPNFAYEMCVRAAAEATPVSNLDLSSLSVAICGGEPVLPSTVRRFLKTFAPAGFNPAAFAPSFGLAESTLFVSSGATPSGPRFAMAPVVEGSPFEVADLGRPALGLTFHATDAAGHRLPEGEIGEIEIVGDSVGTILGEPEKPTLRTGDLGFIRDGRLYITGRRKELIILKGQNVYPADVEMAAMNAHQGIVPGGVAAVGADAGGTQELIVFVEIERSHRMTPQEALAVERTVAEAISRQVGQTAKGVIALRFGSLPRTPSGKIQRNLVVQMYGEGTIGGADRLSARAPAEGLADVRA